VSSFWDFIAHVAETFIAPLDWQVEQSGRSTIFKGSFPVFDRTGKIKLQVPGQIVEWRGLPAQVYLFNPPEFIKRHRHASCLQLLRPNDNWFKLHFDKPATDFASAYNYVEGFLAEAYNLSN
jgi:hypothetical protein